MESKIIKSHTESLMEKLNNFMENDILCDITLVAGDDKIKYEFYYSIVHNLMKDHLCIFF